jgi:hypothetical protein
MSGFALGPLVALSLRTLWAHFEASIDSTAWQVFSSSELPGRK